jgi:hypothetical protein
MPMTLQEVFTTGVSGVIRQGKRSVNKDGHCRYRLVEDNKILHCFIGHCVPDLDSKYGHHVRELDCTYEDRSVISFPEEVLHEVFGDIDIDILMHLQRIHDLKHDNHIENFRKKAFEFAMKHGLDPIATLGQVGR